MTDKVADAGDCVRNLALQHLHSHRHSASPALRLRGLGYGYLWARILGMDESWIGSWVANRLKLKTAELLKPSIVRNNRSGGCILQPEVERPRDHEHGRHICIANAETWAARILWEDVRDDPSVLALLESLEPLGRVEFSNVAVIRQRLAAVERAHLFLYPLPYVGLIESLDLKEGTSGTFSRSRKLVFRISPLGITVLRLIRAAIWFS